MKNCTIHLAGILSAIVIVFGMAADKSHGFAEKGDQQKQDDAPLLKKAEHAKQQEEKARQEKRTGEEEAAQKEQIDSLTPRGSKSHPETTLCRRGQTVAAIGTPASPFHA